MNDAIKTQISAFVDGELPDNESEMLLRRLSQDLELRQQAAEYFAIGRAMKGHRDVKGIATLRERIAAQIGDTEFSETSVRAEPAGSRYTRPLAGAAIAATVALAAIRMQPTRYPCRPMNNCFSIACCIMHRPATSMRDS
jgi:negative regulator of sigma E activity